MTSPSPAAATSKRRSVGHQLSVEDQALNMIAQEAETREATSHAVLVEARKIRNDELERIRKEQDEEEDEQENSDPTQAQTAEKKKPVAIAVSNDVSHSKPSEETQTDIVQMKMKLDEMEAKYKKVMMSNAQLDNEKHTTNYQIELLKDIFSDFEEEVVELKRQQQKTNHELTAKISALTEATSKCNQLEGELQQRDELIKENGLVLVSMVDDCNSGDRDTKKKLTGLSSTLLSSEHLEILSQIEGLSLGEKLKKFYEEKLSLFEENKRLAHELEMERSRFALAQKYPMSNESGSSSPSITSTSIPDGLMLEGDTQKNVTENKLKLRKAEQEITTLQGTVTRLESQVNRYKNASENAEKAEEELKIEKRRLQKELREVQVRVEDLETKNGHLLKRLEKTKSSKSEKLES